jgi:hypothetical protein
VYVSISCFKENHFGGILLWVNLWGEQLEFLKILLARSHFGVQLWRQPIHMDLKIQKLEASKNN